MFYLYSLYDFKIVRRVGNIEVKIFDYKVVIKVMFIFWYIRKVNNIVKVSEIFLWNIVFLSCWCEESGV